MSFKVNSSAIDTTCSICLESVAPGTGVQHIGDDQGTHPFHEACIDKWINGSHIAGVGKCPSCRQEIKHLSTGENPFQNNLNSNDPTVITAQLIQFMQLFPEAAFNVGPNGEFEFTIPIPHANLNEYTGDDWNPMTGFSGNGSYFLEGSQDFSEFNQ